VLEVVRLSQRPSLVFVQAPTGGNILVVYRSIEHDPTHVLFERYKQSGDVEAVSAGRDDDIAEEDSIDVRRHRAGDETE